MERNRDFHVFKGTIELLDEKMIERFGKTLPEDCFYRAKIKLFSDVTTNALNAGKYPCEDEEYSEHHCKACEHMNYPVNDSL